MKKAIIALMLISSSAFAPSLSIPPGTQMPNEEQIRGESAVVASGTVENLAASMDENGFIWTTVTLKVKTLIKGTARGTLQFIVPGGCIPEQDICMGSDLFPVYQIGDTPTVYLRVGPTGELILTTLVGGD